MRICGVAVAHHLVTQATCRLVDMNAVWVTSVTVEGPEAEQGVTGGEEGEVNGQAPNGRDARWPSEAVVKILVLPILTCHTTGII